MKYIKILIAAFLFSVTFPVDADSTYIYNAQLNRVVDGDTMDVTLDFGLGVKMDVRLRIKDFDAPETWRPKTESEREHGKKATQRAIELLSGSFKVKAYGWAVYNRVEADIILEDGRDFASIMKSEGFSKRSTYN